MLQCSKERFECFACTVKFDTEMDRDTHGRNCNKQIEVVHDFFRRSGIPPKHSCPKCYKTYTSVQFLQTHIRLRHGEGMYFVLCDHCDEGFSNENAYRAHTTCTPWKCGVCYRSFSKASQYYNCEFSHKRLPQVQCKFCERNMKREEYLEHLQLWHCQEVVISILETEWAVSRLAQLKKDYLIFTCSYFIPILVLNR